MPIVTNPTAGDVHVNTPLTNFSQMYMQSQDAFIAQRAMPNMSVSKQSDLYYEFDRDDFLRDEAEERADGTESAGGSFSLSTNPYYARVYAYHKDVTDRQRANQDAQVKLEESATRFVASKLLLRREKIFAATYFVPGVWSTDLNRDWSAAVQDPVVDVRTGKRTIQEATGYRPNKMILGRTAYDTLLDNDAILSRITGGSNRDIPAQVMKTLLAQLFELDEIFVMDAIQTTSVKGAATPVRSFIGGDNALLYYAPSVLALEEPTAGAQFSWTGLTGNTDLGTRIKRFRMEQNEADRVEGQMAVDYKVTAPDLGYMFTSVSAA
jgi:hypothetical protein